MALGRSAPYVELAPSKMLICTLLRFHWCITFTQLPIINTATGAYFCTLCSRTTSVPWNSLRQQVDKLYILLYKYISQIYIRELDDWRRGAVAYWSPTPPSSPNSARSKALPSEAEPITEPVCIQIPPTCISRVANDIANVLPYSSMQHAALAPTPVSASGRPWCSWLGIIQNLALHRPRGIPRDAAGHRNTSTSWRLAERGNINYVLTPLLSGPPKQYYSYMAKVILLSQDPPKIPFASKTTNP